MHQVTSPKQQISLASQMIDNIQADSAEVLQANQQLISDELQRLCLESAKDDLKSKLEILSKLAAFILENFFVSEIDKYSLDTYHPDDIAAFKIEVIHQLRYKYNTFNGRSNEENLPMIVDSIIQNIQGVSAEG